MSTTDHPSAVIGRLPILIFALAGIAVVLWLSYPASDNPVEHARTVPEPRAAHITHSAAEPAPAGSGSVTTERLNGPQDAAESAGPGIQKSASQISADTDIPPHVSQPSDVVVEIGLSIDADNPPFEVSAAAATVTNLGPLLDADDPSMTLENSSTEDVSIGEPLPDDQEPY